MNRQLLLRDAGIAKALIWLDNDTFRWCKVTVLSGPNEHGQYHVRRLANGFEGVTTKIMNLTNADKQKIRREYI